MFNNNNNNNSSNNNNKKKNNKKTPHRGIPLQPRTQGQCMTVRPPHSDVCIYVLMRVCSE